jgi:hypothetical protein
MKPGNLLPMFAVSCGMCKEHSRKLIMHRSNGEIARTKLKAAAALRSWGWAYTRMWYWICPDCNRSGSTGVVPESKP